MKRTAIRAMLAAFAAVLLPALLPASPARAKQFEHTLPVDYKLRFTAGSSTVSVEMKYVSAGEGGFVSSLPQSEMPSGPYFEIIRVSDASGNEVAALRDAEYPGWRVDAGGEITVLYDVNLNALGSLGKQGAAPGDPAFSPFVPHWDEGYFFMPGHYLFLTPYDASGDTEYDTCNASFDLPEKWEAWPSWSAGGDARRCAAGGAVFAGEASAVEVQGEIPLTVVQPLGADPANLAAQREFADKLAAQLRTANDAWGRPGIEGGHLLVFLGGVAPGTVDNQELLSIPHYPLHGCTFVPVGGRENILSLGLLERGSEGGLRVMLGRRYRDFEARWFREGCIHYSSLVFAQANSWMDASDAYDRLAADYAAYVDALDRSHASLAEAGDPERTEPANNLLHNGGTVAVASIDASLAAGGKRLSDLVAELFANSVAFVSNQDLKDISRAISGADLNSFFDDHITGTAVIPASAFSQLKLEGNASSGPSGSSPGAGTGIAPAPAFGSGWILMLAAALLVFAVPFLMEPFALRPRGGAVTVTEEELEAERLARKKAYWGERYGEEGAGEDGGGEAGEKPPSAGPPAEPQEGAGGGGRP